MVLLLDLVLRQYLGQLSFTHLSVQICLELFDSSTRVWEIKYGPGQATTEDLRPPENLLLNHLEQAFSVHARYFNFCLQAAHFVRPGHRVAHDTIRSKLHQWLINCIKNALVVDVNRLPYLQSASVGSLLARFHTFLPCLLDLKVELDRYDRVFACIQGRLEVLIAAQFRFLHQFQSVKRRSLDRLSQQLEELDVEVVLRFNSVVKVRIFWDVRDVELQQHIDQLIYILVHSDQISLDQVPLSHFNPLFLLFPLDRVGLNWKDFLFG